MPRSLSGVKSGVFDTLEVSETVQLSDLHTSGKIVAQDLETQGSFSHTGAAHVTRRQHHCLQRRHGAVSDDPAARVAADLPVTHAQARPDDRRDL